MQAPNESIYDIADTQLAFYKLFYNLDWGAREKNWLN